jgi:type II secretory pathway pseudopilin PulG
MPRHFHDDEDAPDVRRADDDRSSTGLLLALLAVLAVVLLGGAGAGLFFLRTRAVQEERVAVMAQAEARAAADAVQAADAFPEPNPPARDGPPADLGPDREPERDGHWTVLFRSDDPAYWDTTGNAAHYAVPLRRAPAGVRFLRLKRMDTGEALIVRVASEQLAAGPVAGEPGRWNGTNAVQNGARHLGAVHYPRLPAGTGAVVVLSDDLGPAAGSGFGHKHDATGAGQRYAWRGQEIAKTAFEVAVTAGDLTDEEKKLLVTGGSQ